MRRENGSRARPPVIITFSIEGRVAWRVVDSTLNASSALICNVLNDNRLDNRKPAPRRRLSHIDTEI